MGIIYCHKNKITGKCYIGHTFKSLEERVGNKPEQAYSGNKSFSNDILKYGWNNFESSILETVDNNNATERETYWINEFAKNHSIYNKCMIGTHNSKRTIRSAHRTNRDMEIHICSMFETGYSMNDISKICGVSINTVQRILKYSGIDTNTQGELSFIQKKNCLEREKFLKSRKCPICGGLLHENGINIKRKTCSRRCASIYKRLTIDERKKIDSSHQEYINEYKELMKNQRQIAKEYIEERNIKSIDVRTDIENDLYEQQKHRYRPKHTAEELQWRKDEVRCKQKLDLILNSGVDLMKFGYNTKLCKMFPELSKKTILFLLRKYRIPHFERVGSKQATVNL